MSTDTHECQPISPLVAELMTASMTATNAVTGQVIDNLTKRAEEAEAMVKAIRCKVSNLLAGPYMPMPAAIEGALWPSDDYVARFLPPKE